ncbi:ABC transporter permease [uncultured Marinococcus sp.]|uniref:ABC transporter permease n=1 Tax=uncultured Marinococcus sp. TaxID=487012 RepID=UPI00261E08E7|nr:ABC transporter permease [uncultured Marinococcus sp.]
MFLAWRELTYAKLRFSLIGLVIFLLTVLVLSISGLAQGLASDNASSMQYMDKQAEKIVLEAEADKQLSRSALSDHDLEVLQDRPEAHVLSLRQGTVQSHGKEIDVAEMYMDLSSELAPSVTDGELPADETEAMIDHSAKENGLRLGDTLERPGGTEVTISGFTENQRYSHTPVLHVRDSAWKQGELPISAVILDHALPEQVHDQLQNAEVMDIRASFEGIPGYTSEQTSLQTMIVFLFLISSIVLAAFYYIMTIQKLSQFGILKAIGATSKTLGISLILQVLLLTTVSIIVGVAVTAGMATVLPTAIPFSLSLGTVLLLAGLFLFVALLGSLLSLVKVIRIDPLKAIGGGQA